VKFHLMGNHIFRSVQKNVNSGSKGINLRFFIVIRGLLLELTLTLDSQARRKKNIPEEIYGGVIHEQPNNFLYREIYSKKNKKTS